VNSKYSRERKKSKVEHPTVMATGDLCGCVDRAPRSGPFGGLLRCRWCGVLGASKV